MRTLLLFLTFSSFILCGAPAAFANGVSDERVSLPDGPGSIGGIGENADIDPNMGLMSTSVPFEIPAGRPGMTPDLRLTYSSGNGTGLVGIGWDFSAASIERTSLRGLPDYNVDDEFAASGGGELVLTHVDGDVRTYRARFEKGFIRYRWHDVGDGSAGYFTAEEPDGRVHFFGADEQGALVDNARVDGDRGVFRYHVVATVDPYGHAIRYSYLKDGGHALLSEVRYLFDDDGDARFSVALAYIDRDDHTSDCTSGVNLVLQKRLGSVAIISHRGTTHEVIRRLGLVYEDQQVSGGASRLQQVTTYGRENEAFPAVMTFAYSASLTGACGGCEGPFVVDMGTIPGEGRLQNGRATLLDINGDALPDLLSTPPTGGHQFLMSSINEDGKPRFAAVAVTSAANVGTGFVLDAPAVQTLDVNGDGFTDIISGTTGEVRCNNGTGDWSGMDCLMNASLPAMEEDAPGEADPRGIRFFDYDNDKRIDVLRTNIGSAEVNHNTPGGFVTVAVEDVGARFDEGTLTLTDMNGDGLQDAAELLPDGVVRFRLHRGFGRWLPQQEVSIAGFDGIDPNLLQLEDINGDGLADVVAVVAGDIVFAINRNGTSFDAAITLTNDDVTGAIPAYDPAAVVLFADMNGSGSTDVVWFLPDGGVRFLELFPERPNLLSRIENGLGRVQVVHYGTSVVEQATSERPWQFKLPNAMNVVTGTDTWVTLTGGEDGEGLHEVDEYTYFDGHYDGEDKRFRGYGEVVITSLADESRDSQPAGRTRNLYDTGALDRYHNGLLVEQVQQEDRDGTWTTLRTSRTEYADCDVDAIGAGPWRLPIRFICSVADEVTHQEGAPVADWKTVRTEREYDGYGNVVLESQLGVVFTGDPAAPAACEACTRDPGLYGAPCNASCEGDEMYTETTFVAPVTSTNGRWILNAPSVEKMSADATLAEASEVRTYYDGPAFEGLALGQLDAGTPTRREQKVDEGTYIQSMRVMLDDHGNVVDELDPLGDPNDTSGHRRQLSYDALGFNVVQVDILLSDDDGPYLLRQQISHEDGMLLPASQSVQQVVRAGQTLTPPGTTRTTYDNFFRRASVERPDDDEGAPSVLYSYELAAPVSTVSIGRRSTAMGPFDLISARCIDGMGRTVQTMQQVSPGNVLVDGFVEHNGRGQAVRVFQPHTVSSLRCQTAPPTDVPFTRNRYDGLHRPVGVVHPLADGEDGASLTRRDHLPLQTRTFDEEDSDVDSPHSDTPKEVVRDGLGRIAAVTHWLGDEQAPTWSVQFDSTGNLAVLNDPHGNAKHQSFDAAGRLLDIQDPNAGSVAFTYDDAGNLVERVDGRGRSVVNIYGGANRLLQRFDADDPAGTTSTLRYDINDDCPDCGYTAGRVVQTEVPVVSALQDELGRTVVDGLAWDARGRLTRFSRTIGDTAYDELYTYDHANRRLSTTTPDGTVLSSTFDGASRLTALDPAIDDVAYGPRGLTSTTTLQNGLVDAQTYDTRLRMTSRRVQKGDTDLLHDVYTLNRAGLFVGVDDQSTSSDALRRSADFDLDAWYRPQSVALNADHANQETVSYTYDAVSNVLSKTSDVVGSVEDVGAYTYDAAPNAITSAGGVLFAYDDAGHVVSRGTHTLRWDAQGRLASYAEDGDAPHLHQHDVAEQRVARLDDDGLTLSVTPSFEVRDGVGVSFARIGKRRVWRRENVGFQTTVLTDVDDDGAITAADAYLRGQGAEGDSTTSLLRAAAQSMLAGPDAYLHHDRLGSIVAETNDSGDVVARRRFTLEGAVAAQEGQPDRYGFTGQEHDASGLVHFRFRMLDPVRGRWLSPDPAFLAATAAWQTRLGEATASYAYVDGLTSTATDPTGLVAKLRMSTRQKGRRVMHRVRKSPKRFDPGVSKLPGGRYKVYLGKRMNGGRLVTVYVGITRQTVAARQAQHHRNGKTFNLHRVISAVSQDVAFALERVLIIRGGGPQGPSLENVVHGHANAMGRLNANSQRAVQQAAARIANQNTLHNGTW